MPGALQGLPLAQRKTERANESDDWRNQLLGMRMLKTADLRHSRCS